MNKFTLVSKGNSCLYKSELQNCSLYRYIEKILKKVNTYDMHLLEDKIPVLFNWTGYDNLLLSHYDQYIFKYDDYQEGPIPRSIFGEIAKFKEIASLLQSGFSKTELDPMAELMGGDTEKRDRDTSHEFEVFKKVSSKK